MAAVGGSFYGGSSTGDVQTWSALDHGVVGDGVTDDTAAIKAFLAAADTAGASAFFPNREYVSSWFYLNIPPRITGAPGATILTSQTNDSWNFGKTSVVASALLTDDADAGQRVVKVATTGISADDLIQVGDTTTLVGGNSATNTATALNTYRVLSIDSTTQLTLAEPLHYDMTVANGAKVNTLDVKRRCWVEGLHFESTAGQATGVTATALRLWYCRDVDIDISMNGYSNAGLIMQDCYGFRVKARAENFADFAVTGFTGQLGYGTDVSGACAHGEVEMLADRVRHAVTFSGTGHNVRVTGVANDCTSGAWDAHAGFTNVEFYDCITRGGGTPDGIGGYAYNLRGDRYRVIGGTADQTNGGVYIFDVPKNVTVRGLTVTRTRHGGHGVQFGDACAGATIEGNSFEDLAGNGVFFNFTHAYTDLVFQSNHFRNVTGAVVKAQTTGSITRARFVDNVVEDNQDTAATTAVIDVPGATISDFTVENNHVANDITLLTGTSAGSVTVGRVSGEGFIEAPEISDPDAPGSNLGRLYVRDNGSGKSELVVRFPTGAVQVIATEP